MAEEEDKKGFNAHLSLQQGEGIITGKAVTHHSLK